METVTVIKDLVGTVGFPIVACIIMFKQNMKLTEIIGDLKTSISKIADTMEEVKNAINK